MLFRSFFDVYKDSFDYLHDPVLVAGNLYGGFMTVAFAYALFTFGVRQVGTATAVTVGLTEPLTATILGVTVLGEVLSPLGIAGLITILVGLIIVIGAAVDGAVRAHDGRKLRASTSDAQGRSVS